MRTIKLIGLISILFFSAETYALLLADAGENPLNQFGARINSAASNAEVSGAASSEWNQYPATAPRGDRLAANSQNTSLTQPSQSVVSSSNGSMGNDIPAFNPPILSATSTLNTAIQVNTPQPPPSLQEGPSDSDIVNSIQRSMAANNEVNDVNVDVECKQGMVRFHGKVNNYVEGNALIIIAESTPGVKDVDVNDLTLRNNTHLTKDAVISAKIRGTFIREGLYFNTRLNPIRVITYNGAVTLIGAVQNEQQKQQAIDLAKSINGVSKVKAQIAIGDINKAAQSYSRKNATYEIYGVPTTRKISRL